MKTTYELFAEIMHEQLQRHQHGSQSVGRRAPPLNLRKLQTHHPTHSLAGTRRGGNEVALDPSAGPRGISNWQLLGLAVGLLVLWKLLLVSAAACPVHCNGFAPASAAAAFANCLVDKLAYRLPDLSWHWCRNL